MADEKTDMPWLDMTSVPGFWLDAPIKAVPAKEPAPIQVRPKPRHSLN